MALALLPHKAIERLIGTDSFCRVSSEVLNITIDLLVVDIAPGVGKISPEFRTYLDAMKEIDTAGVVSRKDADAILAKYEPVSTSPAASCSSLTP
jgi:hypothetical protein